MKALEDSIAVKYEARFPGDTVGRLKPEYAQQADSPAVPDHYRTPGSSATLPNQTAVTEPAPQLSLALKPGQAIKNP
jgi:hypothetical protein